MIWRVLNTAPFRWIRKRLGKGCWCCGRTTDFYTDYPAPHGTKWCSPCKYGVLPCCGLK